MKSTLLQVVNNLGTIILALLLSFVVWIAAKLQADPFSDQTFSNVPISVVNQQDETVFVQPPEDRVSITVRLPSSLVADTSASDLEAILDMATVPPGAPTILPVQVTSRNDLVRIQSWEPTQQTVQLERVATLALPVTVEVTGQVATGYQASPAAVNPELVAVTGPESLLAQVVSMGGTVDATGVRETIANQIIVRPLDAEGRLVAGLQWTPDRVDVRLDVRRRLGYKPDVQVVPDLRGDPAEGYRLGSVSVEPSTVTLAGLPSVLNSLPAFVETWPISVTGATKDLLQLSRMTVPDGVAIVGFDYVTVTVEVLPIQSSRAMTVSVEVQGVRPGWMAQSSPGVVDVILEGPNTILAELTAQDVKVILNLLSYQLGVYHLEPQVLAPEDVTVVSVIPEAIEVVIAPSPTPTPTLTVTPTMTVEP
jgi:YbbR domain-containing protein